jgi:hypothetical protein
MYQSYNEFLFNLEAMTSSEAKRLHRQAIIAHFDSKCVYCGIEHAPSELTLDHVKPRCRGGDSFTKNLVPSCRACNRAKGSNNWLQWMRETFGPTPREQLILSHIN